METPITSPVSLAVNASESHFDGPKKLRAALGLANINDENTLIIHDQSVTNIFRQEFEARWEELNPTSIFDPGDYPIRLFPNPASSYVTIQLPESTHGTMELIDIRGQVFMSQQLDGQKETTLDFSNHLPPGYYIVQVNTSDSLWTSRLVIIK